MRAKDKYSLESEQIPLEKKILENDPSICLCGLDEAGRGPLAGPVVAAAVIFQDTDIVWKARDSKAITARLRASLYEDIIANMIYGIGSCTPEEIDEINILQASLLAMQRAVEALTQRPNYLLVDGLYIPKMGIEGQAVVHGDARVAVISAASIVAKVTRDRIMLDYDKQYPEYGFEKHVGYPTRYHKERIEKYGPSPIHRKTYRGVREHLR